MTPIQRLSHRHGRTGVAALATAALATSLFGTPTTPSHNAHAESMTDDANDVGCHASSSSKRSILPSSVGRDNKIQHQNFEFSSEVRAAASIKEPLLASSPTNNSQTILLEGKENILECDYVVIGHGKAGQSAVRTIKQLDPTADIVVIDPVNKMFNDNATTKKTLFYDSASMTGRIHHLATRANNIEHTKRLIHVHPVARSNTLTSTRNSETANSNSTEVVHYRKSALLATGSRGAPPPESCIRDDAWSRILELRSTALPSTSIQPNPSMPFAPRQMAKHIPVLDPATVRSLSVMAASQGATVAIMGSGFDALELAAYCARVSPKAALLPSNQKHNGQKDVAKKVMLLFGNSSPMSNRLPRYLSAAVTKRLRQFGIDVEDRAMTRYISMDKPMISQTSSSERVDPPRVELYTVKSYDHLDSNRLLADMLVLAPSVDGLNGTAVIPTATSTNPNTHLPWSSLVSPPLLTCYLDDGRIATNSEFHAASSLYAAGSVAKFPNARTGQAEVAGGRHISAELAGALAARNMVGTNIADQTQSREELSSSPCYMHDDISIPVWRSDVVPYLLKARNTGPHEIQPASSSLALYSMGIHTLCVGRCDSEGMATHGFWWTNTNQSNESKNGNGNRSNGTNNGKIKSVGPNAFMRRATRRSNTINSKGGVIKGGSSNRGSLPVYGSGVVYYLDRSGNIAGVMLWGLPFSMDPKDVHSSINDELVDRMKKMILSNGGVAIRDHSEKILSLGRSSIEAKLLSHFHLAEESKGLASMALSGSSSQQELTHIEAAANNEQARKVNVLGKPLHRYTPIKPVELTNIGKMHRRDEFGNLTEEDDLFYSSMSASYPHRVEESRRPPSLKRIYPMQGGMALAGPEDYDFQQQMENRNRSRPPKEEPLWLRQGDESHYVNKRDAMAEAFLANIQSGRFSDGRDALRQAPVPQVYLDAKEKLNSWASGSNAEKEEDVEE